MDLAGANVLVTGASKGIGEAIARAVATRGARVALVARTDPLLREVAAATGGIAYPADLSDPSALCDLVARVESERGAIDVLVNNAGVEVAGPLVEATDEAVERLFRLNLLTPVYLCRQVLPGMLARGKGHIVNISSLAA